MRKIAWSMALALMISPLDAKKEAVLFYEGYHFSIPVDFDRSNKILLDPSQLPPNVLIRDFGLKKTIPYKDSSLTFIQTDDKKPRLLHRGKAIEDLIETMNFSQMSSFLIFGSQDYYRYQPQNLPENIEKLMLLMLKSMPHPSNFFAAFLQLLVLDQTELSEKEQAIYLLNIMPTYAAWTCRLLSGKKDLIQPHPELSVAENFFYMYMGPAFKDFSPRIQKAFVGALDAVLILHADHEVNASTATVRHAASAGVGLVGSISAGCQVLFGTSHGGAAQQVIEMLRAIGYRENIPEILEKAKDKKNKFRLMGFGHHIYKGVDPRVRFLKQRLIELVALLKEEKYSFPEDFETLLDTALELENMAAKDPYFKSHGLYPNVDFYAGLFYQLLGLPSQASTVMFVLARVSGWIAHWFEQVESPTPIIQSRIGYKGPLS